MKIYDDILGAVGRTPLVRLNKLAPRRGARVALKMENMNPLGSLKDRIAVAMVEAAERSGKLKKGGPLVEPTSGNTGVALAMVAAVKGYRLIITMPENMSSERRKLMLALGAEVVLTPAFAGMPGAIRKAREIVKSTLNAVLLQQFENPANPAAHELTTAVEIWEDTEGMVDIVIAGVGTGGTITGVARGLKSRKPGICAVAVEPKSSAVLSGGRPGSHSIQGLGAGFIPKVLDRSLIDEVIAVPDEAAAETAKRLAAEEGLLLGISSGAVTWAALKLARRRENRNKLIVAIMGDTGERYSSAGLFDSKEPLPREAK